MNTHLRTTQPLKPVTTHTVCQLSVAQLCTSDAITGLEEGLKCCEHNSPTPRRTQETIVGTLSAGNSWTTRQLSWTPTLWR